MGHQRIPLETLCLPLLLWCPEVHSLFSRVLESRWSLPLSSSKPASPKPAGTVEWDTQNYTGMAHREVQASCDAHIQPQLCSAPPPQSLWGCDQAPQQRRDTDRTKPKHKLKQISTSSTRDGAGEERRGEDRIKIKPNRKNIAVGEDTMDVCTGGVSFAVLTILVLLLLCGWDRKTGF